MSLEIGLTAIFTKAEVTEIQRSTLLHLTHYHKNPEDGGKLDLKKKKKACHAGNPIPSVPVFRPQTRVLSGEMQLPDISTLAGGNPDVLGHEGHSSCPKSGHPFPFMYDAVVLGTRSVSSLG